MPCVWRSRIAVRTCSVFHGAWLIGATQQTFANRIQSTPSQPCSFGRKFHVLCLTLLPCKLGITIRSWLQVDMRILQGTGTVPRPAGAAPAGNPTPCPFKPPLSLQLARGWDSPEPAQLREGGLATGMGWEREQRRGSACQHPGKEFGLTGAARFSLLPYQRTLQSPELATGLGASGKETGTFMGSPIDTGNPGPGSD